MHPTISYQLTQARLAEMRQHAQRDTLTRAARRAASPARARRADVADSGPRADRVRVRSSQMEIDHVHP